MRLKTILWNIVGIIFIILGLVFSYQCTFSQPPICSFNPFFVAPCWTIAIITFVLAYYSELENIEEQNYNDKEGK